MEATPSEKVSKLRDVTIQRSLKRVATTKALARSQPQSSDKSTMASRARGFRNKMVARSSSKVTTTMTRKAERTTSKSMAARRCATAKKEAVRVVTRRRKRLRP